MTTLADRHADTAQRPGAMAMWLLFTAFMVFAMTVIGAITRLTDAFAAALDTLCDNAVSDMSIISSQRPVDMDELRKLFEYAYAGKPIDF